MRKYVESLIVNVQERFETLHGCQVWRTISVKDILIELQVCWHVLKLAQPDLILGLHGCN